MTQSTGLWSTVDSPTLGSFGGTTATGVAADGLGNVFVIGTAVGGNGSEWLVRKGTAYGTSWSNSDTVGTIPFSGPPIPSDIAIDTFGHVFVVGENPHPGPEEDGYTSQSFIRASTNSGAAWATVVQNNSLLASQLFSVTLDALGNLYVLGDYLYAESPSYLPPGTAFTLGVLPY